MMFIDPGWCFYILHYTLWIKLIENILIVAFYNFTIFYEVENLFEKIITQVYVIE